MRVPQPGAQRQLSRSERSVRARHEHHGVGEPRGTLLHKISVAVEPTTRNAQPLRVFVTVTADLFPFGLFIITHGRFLPDMTVLFSRAGCQPRTISARQSVFRTGRQARRHAGGTAARVVADKPATLVFCAGRGSIARRYFYTVVPATDLEGRPVLVAAFLLCPCRPEAALADGPLLLQPVTSRDIVPSCRDRGVQALTDAERAATYRARLKAAAPAPKVRYRRPADRRTKPQRWRDAVAELAGLQADYTAWLEALPASLRDSATADALRAICDFDLAVLEALEPPRGFGRD